MHFRKPDMPWRKPVHKVEPEGWDDLLDSLVKCALSIEDQEAKLSMYKAPEFTQAVRPSQVESWAEWAEYEWSRRTQTSDKVVLVNNLNAARANFKKLSAKVAKLMPVVGTWFKHSLYGVGLKAEFPGWVSVHIASWKLHMSKLI